MAKRDAGVAQRDGVRAGLFAPSSDSRLIARSIFGAVDELALEWAMSDRIASLERELAYIEALRELAFEEGPENCCFVALTYILEPSILGEQKSKAARPWA